MNATSAVWNGRAGPPAIIASLLLALLAACAYGERTFWQHDPATPGDWSDPANWTQGVPGPDLDGAVDNGGEARIASGQAEVHWLLLGQEAGDSGFAHLAENAELAAAKIRVGIFGSGSFEQTGGTNWINGDLVLGAQAGSNGVYVLDEGSLRTSGEVIGSYGVGSLMQAGGWHEARSQLIMGYHAGSIGTYQLSGDGEFHTNWADIGWGGSGTVVQTGGMADVGIELTLGLLTDSSGTYELHGGLLTAKEVHVGKAGAGSLIQDGGELSAERVIVGPTGRYEIAAGTLGIKSLDLKGVLDFAGGSITWSTDVGLIDLADGQVLNAGNASLHLGFDTLLAVPAGVNPSDIFGAFSSTGLIQEAGTPLLITSGRSLTVSGAWRHPIHCEGTLGTPTGKSLDLTGGVTVSGDGRVDLYWGDLTVPGGVSAVSGGVLETGHIRVGGVSSATFAQSAGKVMTNHSLYLGHEEGLSGTCELTGGELSASYVYVGQKGAGLFVHDAGINAVGNDLILGDGAGAEGEYRLSGPAQLTAEDLFVGKNGKGVFAHWGGSSTLEGKLSVGFGAGSQGQYVLGPGAHLSAANAGIGGSGTGLFVQSGGISTIERDLTIDASGRYELSAGEVSARTLHVGLGGQGELIQSGGAVAVERLDVGTNGRYELLGGTLEVTTLKLLGVLDLADSGVTLAWDGVQLNLMEGSIVNASNASLTLGPDTLLMLPAGFDPHSEFGTFSSAGSIYAPGSTLVVPPGRTIELRGLWTDRVVCEGTVTAEPDASPNLAGGVNVVGGAIELARARVTVSDDASGISSGRLDTYWTDVDGSEPATFLQTGGRHAPRWLRIGYSSGQYGTYRLEGGELDATNLLVGKSGSGTFVQTGGTNTVSVDLEIGTDNGSEGAYEMSGGLLSAQRLIVGAVGTGTFLHAGGAVQADSILLGPTGWYQYTAGTLEFDRMVIQGQLDLAGSSAEMRLGTGLIDLTAGSVTNAQNASLRLGSGTLLLTPAGFDPYGVFGSFHSDGVVHTPGSALIVPVGTSVVMSGTVADHVDCRGTLAAPAGGEIVLTGGVTVSGAGQVDMGTGSLTVEDGPSQVSGGRLEGDYVYVGYAGTGTVTQTGGQVEAWWKVILGHGPGTDGIYLLSGGELSCAQLVVGREGTGRVTQSGGNAVGLSGLVLGVHEGSQGLYELSSGKLAAASQRIGSSGTGTLVQTGGENQVDLSLSVGASDGGGGTYQLVDGVVAANRVSLGGTGLFDQTGGSVSAGSVYVASNARYRFAGGTLEFDSLTVLGKFDFAGRDVAVGWDNVTLDLRDGQVVNALDVSLTIGPDSLLLVGAGFDPSGMFGSFDSSAVTYEPGTPLVIPAGRTVTLDGEMDDPVICEGTLQPPPGGSIMLNEAPTVSGDGLLDLGGGSIPDAGGTLLSGGRIKAAYEAVWYGTFAHTGGVNTVTDALWIGRGLTRYELSGDGRLEAKSVSVSGRYSSTHDVAATFAQTGGTHVVGKLVLGGGKSDVVVYELSGGVLSADVVTVGPEGTAELIQTGGDAAIGHLAIGPDGRYEMTGGVLDIAGGLSIEGELDFAGAAVSLVWDTGLYGFRADSVLNAENVSLTLGDNTIVIVGDGPDPASLFGSYTCTGLTHLAGTTLVLPAGRSFVLPGDFPDHVRCEGVLESVPNGALSLANGLELAGGAEADLGGGVLVVRDDISGLTDAQLTAAYEMIGLESTGAFTQTGGVNTVGEYLYVGVGADGDGTYTLTDGRLSTSETRVGEAGPGRFVHFSGTHTVNGRLAVGSWPGSDGRYELSGGTLTAESEHIGDGGRGAFVQTGGTHTVGGRMRIGYGVGADGTYTLHGGSLSVGGLHVGIDGRGVLDVQDAAASITVAGPLLLGEGAEVLAVPGSTIHTTGEGVAIECTDPSAVAGLANLTLVFEGAGEATLEAAGADLGPVAEGWQDNFAIGTLQVGRGQPGRLRLVDEFENNADPSGPEAVYVDGLVLGQGAAISLGGLNLYYLNGSDPKKLILGDANLDGSTGLFDLMALAGNYGATGRPGWAAGDFNGDGIVGIADLTALADNYSTDSSSPGGTSVPEPATLTLLLPAWAALLRRRTPTD